MVDIIISKSPTPLASVVHLQDSTTTRRTDAAKPIHSLSSAARRAKPAMYASSFCSTANLTPRRLDVSTPLRRAIPLNDALLVKRIVTKNPAHIRNPDVDDRTNTSLHLASKLGCVEIMVRGQPSQRQGS